MHFHPGESRSARNVLTCPFCVLRRHVLITIVSTVFFFSRPLQGKYSQMNGRKCVNGPSVIFRIKKPPVTLMRQQLTLGWRKASGQRAPRERQWNHKDPLCRIWVIVGYRVGPYPHNTEKCPLNFASFLAHFFPPIIYEEKCLKRRGRQVHLFYGLWLAPLKQLMSPKYQIRVIIFTWSANRIEHQTTAAAVANRLIFCFKRK